MPSAADATRPVHHPSANVHPPLEGEATTLSEAEAKSLLAGAGLPVPRGEPADSANAAIDAAQRLGYPVAVKALGIAHKSEAGAVRVGLHDSGECGKPPRRSLAWAADSMSSAWSRAASPN